MAKIIIKGIDEMRREKNNMNSGDNSYLSFNLLFK